MVGKGAGSDSREPGWRYLVEIDGAVHEVTLFEREGHLWAAIGDEKFPAELRHSGPGALYTFTQGAGSVQLGIAGGRGDYQVNLHGRDYRVRVERTGLQTLKARLSRDEQAVDRKQERVITAVMPGLIVKVEVTEGQAVSEGDSLVIIEAMKMENQIRAPCAGIVKRIDVAEGEEVDGGQRLCLLEYR
ncbi:MAG: acetyl-CoA carboxylase biotin carboxyl carrier protein subunit [Candidatus Bipolaricaulia bacterium]